MSAGSPRDPAGLGRNCVTRPRRELSRRFLNENRHLDPDCVTSCPEVKSGQRPARLRRHRAALRVRASQPSPKAILFLLVAVFLAPRRYRATHALSLALRVAADMLPITRTHVRLEPPSADPARTLAGHRPQRRAASTPSRPPSTATPSTRPGSVFASAPPPRPGSAPHRWVTSHEHKRVNSREP